MKEIVIPVIRQALSSFFDVGFRVYDMFVKYQVKNDSPMHQDKFTGGDCFRRSDYLHCYFDGREKFRNLKPKVALRMLIDMGGFDSASSSERKMVYTRRNTIDGQNVETVLFETSHRFVAMDAFSAGSGGRARSNIYHGRYGDGITVSVDLVLPAISNSSKLPKYSRHPAARLLHAHFHGRGKAARDRALKNLWTEGSASQKRHCYICGNSKNPPRKHIYYKGKVFDGVCRFLCWLCYDESVRYSNGKLIDLVRYHNCPGDADCKCVYKKNLRFKDAFTLAQERARAVSATADFRKPHCHFCNFFMKENDYLADHFNSNVVDGNGICVHMCYGCRKTYFLRLKGSRVRPHRHIECKCDLDSCSGCRKPPDMCLKRKEDFAIERAQAVAQSGAPRKGRHCHRCGTNLKPIVRAQSYQSSRQLFDSMQQLVWYCAACIRTWRDEREEIGKEHGLVRLVNCPEISCPGCHVRGFDADEEDDEEDDEDDEEEDEPLIDESNSEDDEWCPRKRNKK